MNTMERRGWRVRAVAVALGAGVALAGCGAKTVNRTISAAVVNGKPGFDPAQITVDKGAKVSVRVGNTTEKPHGFSIEGYSLGTPKVVQPGVPLTVKFTASKAGTFKIFCQLHPAHQSATLVVR